MMGALAISRARAVIVTTRDYAAIKRLAHGTLDQRQIYRTCYGLLVVTALKLLWDGVTGYLG